MNKYKLITLILLLSYLTGCVSNKNTYQVRILFDKVCITAVNTEVYEEKLLCNKGVLFSILF